MSAPAPTLLALLERVKQHPHDLSVRLVLADWLEENGQPADVARAEVIRLHCSPHRVHPGHPDRDRQPLVKQRVRGNRSRWLAPLPRQEFSWKCLGGLFHLTLTASHAQRRLVRLARHLEDPTALAAWAWVEEININALSYEDLTRSGLPRLPPGPRCLNLGFNELGPAGGRFLAGCRELAHLAALQLFVNRLGMEGVSGLLTSPYLSELAFLNVGTNDLGDAGAQVVAERAEILPRLESLGIYVNRLTDDGARSLGSSRHLSGLRYLDVSFNGLGPEGVSALVRSPHLCRLRCLDLEQNPVGDEGARVLAESAAALSSLVLRGAGIRLVGVSALANSPHLESLRVLDLRDNELGTRAAYALARSSHLGALEFLDLSDTQIGAKGGLALAQADVFRSLRHLDLGDNQLGDQVVARLAQAPFLAGLTHLHLARVGMSDVGAKALADSPHLGGLVELDLAGNGIGEVGQKALQKRFRKVVNLK